MSGPATATSYEESVGSCGPPTPPAPSAPSAPRGAPVRRQLGFTFTDGGGDLGDDDDDEEFLCRVADDIERGYGEAKRRAPPCVCGRGVCAVERDGQSGRWKYVCPSRPKCNHVAFWEEVDLTPKSLPASRNDPKPSNNPSNSFAFNNPSDHMAGPRIPVNTRPQVTGVITPVNARPQFAGATTLFSDSCQGAGTATLANISPRGEDAATLGNDSPQGACAATPSKFIQQGAVATTLAKISPQGARSNFEEPVCQCKAGKCRKTRVGKEDYYVCPIPKGKGACSYKVLVHDFVKDIVHSPQATTPCNEVRPESPSMLHRPIAVNTPSKSPMRRPYGTPSAVSPKSNDICYRCHEKGHWSKDCPKRSLRDNACFKCGMVGHWSRNCPQL